MKYILTIVCFAVSLTSRCQDSERQRYWEFGFFRGGPSYAYFYDGNHYFEGGLKLNLIKNDYTGRAFGIIPGFQFTRSNDVSYVNPFASINCFFDTDQDFTCTVRLSL